MISPSDAVKSLEWDSAFFGKGMARLFHPDAFASEEIFNDYCKKQGFEQVQACIEADNENSVRTLTDLGFELVDLKLTMTCRVTKKHQKITPDPDIYLSTQADIKPLLEVCHGSFNQVSRYNWRDFLTQDQISAFYDTWLENGVKGKHDDFCFHYKQGEKILGFTTISLKDNAAYIGIIAVAKESRGRGIGDKLMDNVFTYAATHELTSVASVTQGKNTPTQHLYHKHGLEVSQSECWYYKIIGEVA
jgi:ribosomal protein S18 acetylase RimI-like enzyme